MEHVYWIIEQLLAGRPGPVLAPWKPQELYTGGLRTIVSLAQEEETEDLAPYGFTHHRAPFPPVLLFSKGMRNAFIYQALPVWNFIHQQLKLGNPVCVHCHHGQDRTGVILAGYLIIYRNVPPQQALQQLRAAKPTALSADGYEQVLDLLRPGVIPDRRRLL